MKGRIFLASALLSLSLAGCSSNSEQSSEDLKYSQIELMYEQAQEQLEMGNLNLAQEQLAALSSRYPFGPFAHQVQLDLIYVHYKLDNTDEAISITYR